MNKYINITLSVILFLSGTVTAFYGYLVGDDLDIIIGLLFLLLLITHQIKEKVIKILGRLGGEK